MGPYKIAFEQGEYVVTGKRGLILAYFGLNRDAAADYAMAQRRADEQSAIMGEFNRSELFKELQCELVEELKSRAERSGISRERDFLNFVASEFSFAKAA